MARCALDLEGEGYWPASPPFVECDMGWRMWGRALVTTPFVRPPTPRPSVEALSLQPPRLANIPPSEQTGWEALFRRACRPSLGRGQALLITAGAGIASLLYTQGGMSSERWWVGWCEVSSAVAPEELTPIDEAALMSLS